MFGLRSLLIVKKVLMKNNLASGHAASNQQPANGLNEYGRYVEKNKHYCLTFKKVCLLNLFIFS